MHHLEILEFIESKGKKTFNFEEIADLTHNVSSAYFAVYMLSKKKLIKKIAKDFFVIYSPTEKRTGTISPDSYIDQLMVHKKISYYTGLLSAASLYGAAHQRPVVYQVITGKQILIPKKFVSGIEFHYKKYCPSQCIIQRKGQYGYINYSSPALTAYDLIKFERDSGTLYNVIPVISELLVYIKASDVKDLLKNELETAYVQRLGYILERLGYEKTKPLLIRSKNATANVPFSRLEKRSGIINTKWKVIDNLNWEDILAT